MHEHEADIDEALVRRLLAAQLPDLASTRLAIVEPWGTDNAIWRVGATWSFGWSGCVIPSGRG